MSQPKVTVVLSTYNQVDYIREALDSILMQKTTFPFEILAADDSSNDGTQEVILEYQRRHPNLIHTYFTPENLGDCRKFANCVEMGLLHGEYLAHLEGDDYWLREDRLQILSDFLDAHPEYSRVTHRTLIVDEEGKEKGYDLPLEKCGRPFTVEDFLAGEQYSSVDSMYRNYYKTVGGKYSKLQTVSRNVSDFQDMFITQDFGPVFILPDCLSAYRCRSVSGEFNYNSIMSQEKRSIDKITIAQAVEAFYPGRYDLTPRIRREQRKLYDYSVANHSLELLEKAKSVTDDGTHLAMMARCFYLALRARNWTSLKFVWRNLCSAEKCKLPVKAFCYGMDRAKKRRLGLPYEDNRRGYSIKTGRNAPWQNQ